MEHMLQGRDIRYIVSIPEESVAGYRMPREEIGRFGVVFR
jgi:hypothetical protein